MQSENALFSRNLLAHKISSFPLTHGFSSSLSRLGIGNGRRHERKSLGRISSAAVNAPALDASEAPVVPLFYDTAAIFVQPNLCQWYFCCVFVRTADNHACNPSHRGPPDSCTYLLPFVRSSLSRRSLLFLYNIAAEYSMTLCSNFFESTLQKIAFNCFVLTAEWEY